MSASVGVGLLQMVLELDTGRRASEEAGPPRGDELWDPTSVWEGNKIFLISVWKSLPSRRVLKLWGETQKGKPKEAASNRVELLQLCDFIVQ